MNALQFGLDYFMKNFTNNDWQKKNIGSNNFDKFNGALNGLKIVMTTRRTIIFHSFPIEWKRKKYYGTLS